MAIAEMDAGRQTSRRLVVSFIGQLISAYIERRGRRREIAELMSLGPGALRDLAIDPSEIRSIVHSAGRDTTRINR